MADGNIVSFDVGSYAAHIERTKYKEIIALQYLPLELPIHDEDAVYDPDWKLLNKLEDLAEMDEQLECYRAGKPIKKRQGGKKRRSRHARTK